MQENQYEIQENLEPMQSLDKRNRKESLEMKRLLVGVAGGSASGKTTICENIRKEMTLNGDIDVLIISLDCFYKSPPKDIDPKDFDFDSPNALDFVLAKQVLQSLIEGKETQVPRYNFCTHSREDVWDLVKPTDIILFEGILALYDEEIRNLMQYSIFMHTDDDIRLCRRLIRDNSERGRQVDGILFQYNRFVKRSFDLYIKPTMNFADIIVPGRDNNQVSVQFIVDYLKTKAIQLGLFKKAMKRDVVFIGDLIDDNIFQKKIDSNYSKIFLAPIFEDDRKKVLGSFYNIKEGVFSKKICTTTFKDFTKVGIKIWNRVCVIENIKESELHLCNLGQINDNSDNDELFKTDKQFILICVPTIVGYNEQLAKIFTNFQKHSPNSSLILISFFANIKILKQYNEQFDNIKKLLTILCLGNIQKFQQMIQDNAKDEQTKQSFYDLNFQSDKIYKQMQIQVSRAKKQQNNQGDSSDSD